MGKHWWIILLFVVLILLAVFIVWWSNWGVSVSEYTVTSERLPQGFDGYKIVHLSDLHSASIGEGNRRLIAAIEKEAPDIVVMTGDMVSRYDTDFTVAVALAADLAAKYPVYFIPGNHETGLSKEYWTEFITSMVKAGVVYLDNISTALTAENGDTVSLTGLWYNLDHYHKMASYYIPFTAEDMEATLGSAPEGYNILLAHNPNDFAVYAEWGADLSLSGHIHGGMIRLPLIGGVLSPETILFPEYDAGLYTIGEQHMILSRGLGRGKMGIRLFNAPDVVSITLQTAE